MKGVGTTRGSMYRAILQALSGVPPAAAARPSGQNFCGGVGAPHYVQRDVQESRTHHAHTLTHSRTHTHAVIALSHAPTLILTIMYIYDGSKIILERTHTHLLADTHTLKPLSWTTRTHARAHAPRGRVFLYAYFFGQVT